MQVHSGEWHADAGFSPNFGQFSRLFVAATQFFLGASADVFVTKLIKLCHCRRVKFQLSMGP